MEGGWKIQNDYWNLREERLGVEGFTWDIRGKGQEQGAWGQNFRVGEQDWVSPRPHVHYTSG